MIYIGLPVHDEEHTVGVLLWRIRKLLAEEDREFRVLVVDDGSTDATAEVLDPYRRVLPLTVLRHRDRRGYAASVEHVVREVLDASGYHRRDGLVLLQADFTEAPEVIPEMVRRFQGGADLVAGRPAQLRHVPGGLRLARKVAPFLLRGLDLPDGAGDPTCGFRVYRLFVLDGALRDARRTKQTTPDDGTSGERAMLHHDGWAANVELLLRVLPHVRRMERVEFPLDYGRRYRESRFRPLRELWEVGRLLRETRRMERPPAVSDARREAS